MSHERSLALEAGRIYRVSRRNYPGARQAAVAGAGAGDEIEAAEGGPGQFRASGFT